MTTQMIWECKIGNVSTWSFPEAGADLPMRAAVEKAFLEVTGCRAEFIFSGWSAKLTDSERKVIRRTLRI